jgi:trehalose 6-phosphate synthase
MGRLIVVSNRVQPPTDAGGGSVGGLAMALAAALREANGVWFGWSGRTTETYSGQVALERTGGVTIATVDLEEQDVHEYYNGYANKTLWPLFHYRVDLSAYERAFSEGYGRVNARFAEALLPMIRSDDVIWVHDYHLIPMAQELRRHGLNNRIGFFLHIPWPARRLLTTLPDHPKLVEALFDYDVVGFQTLDSLSAFEDYVTQVIGGEVIGSEATAFGRTVDIGAFPIGLDVDAFAEAATGQTAQAEFEKMQISLAGRQMVVGVDRLDYSKGLEERFLAYEQFLQDNEDLRERVFLLQIATPSREEVDAYQDIRARLDAVTGRINGAYATVDWVPIRYVNRAYRRDELAGIYRAAKIGLVTPLRDGMNLVAKEYVAAQDPDDPGTLILSEFAGASEQMTEALIVNPFDREEVAGAIARGLTMPREERIERWQALMAGLKTHDLSVWREAFVQALRGRRSAAA